MKQFIKGSCAVLIPDDATGVSVVPVLGPGASDAQLLNPAGIPTYEIDGFF
jgi:hypothetical protein